MGQSSWPAWQFNSVLWERDSTYRRWVVARSNKVLYESVAKGMSLRALSVVEPVVSKGDVPTASAEPPVHQDQGA